jgi:hypothetical protein
MLDHSWCPAAGPLHEGMRFAAANYTGVAMWFSALWAVVPSAAHSVLGRLPIEAFQVEVVGEKVAKFPEQAAQCSRLETSGLRVCDLILGLADDRAPLVVGLEQAVARV